MDVRDLAPALIAVGQLIDAANTALNADGAKVKVQVTATSNGSFEIDLEVVQTLHERLVSLLTGTEITAAANLIALITAAGGSLFWLIKKTRGASPKSVERLSPDTVRLVMAESTIDISITLLRLYQDVAVRSAAQRLVEEPLKNEGIDHFEVRDAAGQVLSVEKSEAPYFSKPTIPDETLLEQDIQSAFSIISLAFKEDNKWRLYDGNNVINASIADQDFLARVDANQIAFSKGDILICSVHVTQRQTDQGLKTDHVVTHVLDHRPGARQLPLPFSP
jgi:hypothetical protein